MKIAKLWIVCMVVLTSSALPSVKRHEPEEADQIRQRQESREMSDVRSPEQGDSQAKRPSPERGPVRESDGKQADVKPISGTWLHRLRPHSSKGADKLPPMEYMQKTISRIRDSIQARFRRPREEERNIVTQPKIRPMLPGSESSKTDETEEVRERVKPKVRDGEKTKSGEGAKQPEAAEHIRRKVSQIRDSIQARFRRPREEARNIVTQPKIRPMLPGSESSKTDDTEEVRERVKPKVRDGEKTKSGEEAKQPEAAEHIRRKVSQIRDSIQARFRRPREEARNIVTQPKIRPMLPGSESSKTDDTEEVRERVKPKVRDGEKTKSGEEAKQPEAAEHIRRKVSQIRDSIQARFRRPDEEEKKTLTQPKILPLLSGSESDEVQENGWERAKPKVRETKSGEEAKQPEAAEHMRRMISQIRDRLQEPFPRPEARDGERTKSGEEAKQPEAAEHMRRMISQIRDRLHEPFPRPEARDGERTKSGEESKQPGRGSEPKLYNPGVHQHEKPPTKPRIGDGERAESGEEVKQQEGRPEPKHYNPAVHRHEKQPTKPGIGDGESAESGEGVKRQAGGSEPKHYNTAVHRHEKPPTKPGIGDGERTKPGEGIKRQEGGSEPKHYNPVAHRPVKPPTKPKIHDGERAESGKGVKRPEEARRETKTQERAGGTSQDRDRLSMSNESIGDPFASGQSRESPR